MKQNDIIFLNQKLPVTVHFVLRDSLAFDQFLKHISGKYCPFINGSISANGFFSIIINNKSNNTTSLLKEIEEFTQSFIHHVYNSNSPKHIFCLCLRFETLIRDDVIISSIIDLENKYKKLGVLFGKFFRDRIFRSDTETSIKTPESFLVVRFVIGVSDMRFFLIGRCPHRTEIEPPTHRSLSPTMKRLALGVWLRPARPSLPTTSFRLQISRFAK